MEVKTAFVSGANRGIGLEMVKQLANLPMPPEIIFATYRDKKSIKNLEQIQNEVKGTEIILIQMDVSNSTDIKAAGKIVSDKLMDKGLNLLMNNAGIYKEEKLSEITEENLLNHFSTNAMGPILLFQPNFKPFRPHNSFLFMNLLRASIKLSVERDINSSKCTAP
ncbi:uncharacterized protein NPIL_325371 [Nephila pilipes]|uniref:Uncharacterized protein n=1 Tax=Nephila pilipes TaxID=299642 RepID=A0A8X6MUN5_NEPPI|nr:uncharacterized protein NPIL_325371 [Nephila pilipes]